MISCALKLPSRPIVSLALVGREILREFRSR
jgi:hypothetical protein